VEIVAFDTDVFISYAHLDNQPLTEGSQGWVSEFHEALTKRLGELLARPPRIWRDPKLSGNDVFADALTQRFSHSAVLVSVVTPRYLESEWCRREVDGFWQAAAETGGPVVRNKARVFKVVKTPVDRRRLPPEVEPLLGYEFYRIQSGSGRPLEFNRIYGADAERDFWMRLNDLVYDLADLLEILEPSQPPVACKATVYLAQTTSDLQPQHDALRRELLQHGYAVLPDRELPLLAPEAEQAVTQDLEASRLSIHLIGAAYGVIPEGTDDSFPALQAEFAAARARTAGLVRLVWIAPGTSTSDQRHEAFVEALRKDPTPAPGSDLLETSFDDLQTLAFARLAALETPRAPVPQAAPAAAPRIYLICTEPDLEAVEPLRQHLFAQGFEVQLPAFEGDDTVLRVDHETQLRECDAVLIEYGAGGELWLRQKLGDLRRLPALGRAAPLRGAAILVMPPETPAKQRLLTHDALVVRGAGELPFTALEAFTAPLRA
jgi:hypothetical protein